MYFPLIRTSTLLYWQTLKVMIKSVFRS
uniref:Uncharacterized protein n=1 Tax=Anguilla anguilla TaxID=7936 RepID=A0A0E9VKU8_ANGAN